jgi:hypothetical protein
LVSPLYQLRIFRACCHQRLGVAGNASQGENGLREPRNQDFLEGLVNRGGGLETRMVKTTSIPSKRSLEPAQAIEWAAHVDFEQEALNECRLGLTCLKYCSNGRHTAIANSTETDSGAKQRRRPDAGDSLMPEEGNQTETAEPFIPSCACGDPRSGGCLMTRALLVLHMKMHREETHETDRLPRRLARRQSKWLAISPRHPLSHRNCRPWQMAKLHGRGVA